MGHKRLALEAGEDPKNAPLSYVLEAIRTIYAMKAHHGEIRRVNVNIAALDVDGYRQLKQAGIGTYILFQETYHRATYKAMHSAGPKSDFLYHATAFDRAQQAGLDDVGGGALFGLYDPCYEALGLLLHNQHLEATYGVGFHTISVPRLRATHGTSPGKFPYAAQLDDMRFLRIVAALRLAVPYTGLIISTRESADMRRQLLQIGASQISGGSVVDVGGYARKAVSRKSAAQFSVADERTPAEILLWLLEEGYIPSFCTACYRRGRTGDHFMQLAKSGRLHAVCTPNALMTLTEYAMDYGNAAFREKAFACIAKKAAGDLTLQENIRRIQAGERDLYL